MNFSLHSFLLLTRLIKKNESSSNNIKNQLINIISENYNINDIDDDLRKKLDDCIINIYRW